MSSSISLDGMTSNGASVSLAASTVENGAVGRGGDINITAKFFSLANQARLSARSLGSGNGGSITVNAGSIRLRGNSNILTFSAFVDGGNIPLNAKTIIALENSDILAFAPVGRGGNITFNTFAFLSDPLYRSTPPITDRAVLNALSTNGRVDVNASGAVSGAINGVPDISFLQNSLTQLPTSLTDTNQLLANSCIVRRGQPNGSFFITGSGGLPQRPGDAPISPFPTGTIRTIANTNSSEARPWKIGDPIVEPQGIYRLANGKLVMSRECK